MRSSSRHDVMAHFETTFGDIRSLAQRPADAHTWCMFMGALVRSVRGDEELSEYARAAARRWPDAQRVAPAHVMRELGEGRASRWLHLARALTLDPSTESWIGRPELSGVTHLTYDARWGDAEDAVRRLWGGSFMRGLSVLSVLRARDGARVARVLAEVDAGASLRALTIRPARFGFLGARALANAGVFAQIEALTLEDPRCGVAGARSLFEGAGASMRSMTLRGEAGFELGDAGARAAAEVCPRTLESLTLSRHAIGDEGARALAASTLMGSLTTLDLSENAISGAGARALERALSRSRQLV